jgi:outer membrane murein-binding lipoprotein Lpp
MTNDELTSKIKELEDKVSAATSDAQSAHSSAGRLKEAVKQLAMAIIRHDNTEIQKIADDLD